MPTELEKCQQQAKRLPLKERAMLIKALINDLDKLDEKLDKILDTDDLL